MKPPPDPPSQTFFGTVLLILNEIICYILSTEIMSHINLVSLPAEGLSCVPGCTAAGARSDSLGKGPGKIVHS